MEPVASELTRELLSKAEGLADAKIEEGRIVNWPADVIDLMDRTAQAIGNCEDPAELQRAQEWVEKAKRRILPWKRVPRDLIIAVLRGIADNPHFSKSGT